MQMVEAKQVSAGDYVTSVHTVPPLKPLRVTRAWVNRDGTIARFLIHGLRDAWVDSSGVEMAPKGMDWDTVRNRWAVKEKRDKRVR